MVPDFAEDSTIRLGFVSTAPDGTPTAPSAAFTAADFAVYKDGSATEKTTTNGITVTSPFDSIAGRHLLSIDTSNDTGDAGFWSAGSVYEVILSTAKTVDSKSVSGYSVGEFRLGGVRIDSASVTAVQSGLSTLDAAGVRSAVGMASANLDTQLSDVPTVAEFEARTLLAAAYFDPAADTVTVGTNQDKTGYSLTVDPPTAAAVADAVWDEATSGHTAAGTYGGRIVRSTNSNVEVQITGSNHIAADVHEFQADVLTSAATDATFISEVQSGLATSEALATVDGLVDLLVSRSGYQMSILAGAISNAQDAAEAYSITLDGSTYSVTYSGLDASGNRSGATLVTT